MNRGALKDLELYQEDGLYYLKATYRHEDDEHVYETVYPKIFLDVDPFGPRRIDVDYSPYCCSEMAKIDLGFGSLPAMYIEHKDCNCYGYTEAIETKTKKMTLKEIEKQLGHKVELVSEKGE